MGHSGKAGENIFWAMNRNKPGIIKRILNALERFIARIRDKDAYLAVEQRQAAERLRDMLTGELKRAYGTDVKGEAAVESDGGKRHSLAGANSRTADLNSLGGAYQMYQNGVSMDTIRKRTGWWLGKDGKWRYEISDKEMQFNPDGFVKNPTTVGDYVKHDRLFAAYPWIADIPVHMVDVVTGGSPATNGKFSPDGKFIELKKGLTSEKAKYVLSHELQHAIQQAEGFVRGTSPKTGMFYAVNLAYDLVKNNPEFVAESKPQDKMNYLIGYLEAKGGASLGDYAKYYYFQNYGETEARNVSQRLDMTEEERRALPIENNGEVFSYDEVFEKIVDNLKTIGYNKKQIDTILKEGVSYDIEQTDVQTSADEVVKRRRNDRGETARLSDADENGRRPGEIYRTGKIPTAGVSESAEILDSERRNGGLRRGNRGTDSQNGALGAGSEAGKKLNEVSKPEKKFSLSSTVEQTKDLIAVHNMTAAELEKSLDLGGLPMPSIAIIKAADGHSEYGDVSLVFGKDTIDPKKSARNKVYGGDAWTPTFPKIDYKANEKVGKRIRDKYYDLSRKYGYDNTRALYNYAQDLSDVLTSEGGEKAMIDKLYGDTGMMQIYLMDTGRERVANVNKETKTALTDGQVRQYENLIDALGRDEMNGFAKKDGEELSDLVRRRKAFIAENEAGIRKAFEKTFIEDGMSAKDAAEVSAELALSDLRKYVLDTFNYIKNGAETVKTEFDSEATDAAIKKAADGEGYRKWINNLFGGAEEKSGIRNSKDAYTASGNRRSFEALHWENNLENIVKAMLEQDETGGAFFSGTGIWGVSAKKYNSISEIKNDSSRLRTMNEAEYNALKEQYGARMQEIAQTLIDPKNDNYFIASDDAYSLIVDAVRNSKDESGILRYLKKYNSRATEKTASDIAALVRDISEMPTGYFEAKPQRAVGFDEVKAVILPDNASGELVSRLESDGINTVTYKAGDENSRLEALNGVRDVRFSLTRANDEYMKAVESGDTEEQRRLVDEAAKANGYDRLFWHGSKKGGGFTEFRDWSYFTENKKYASRYAKPGDNSSLYEVYANLGNAFDTRKPECREIFDKMRSEYGLSEVQESGLPDWTDGYDIAEFIDENGLDYDSIILDEGGDLVDGKPVSRGFSYVIRSSEQVKSADPITYDDSGNVIPLTERFDSGNRDIRWSLAGTDKDRADAAEFSDSGIRYSLRKEDPPKKTLTGYKVFVVKNGKLYPPMVANPDAADTPVGVWLNADIGAQAPDSKTGRKQVKAGGKGTQGGSGSLAFRPGWHLGETPLATQFDRTNPETGKRELFPENFVWAECEIAADKNYQEEAMSYGYTKSGKFQHSLAGLPKIPVDGYYKYRTNPNPDTVPWLITGAMKVNRLLDDAEVNRILESKGLPPKNRVGGNKTLADLGLEETAKRLNGDGDGDGNIRYSLVKSAQSELKALQKENEKLRQDVDDLKQELQLTHGRKLSRDALISSIQKILIDGYGVKLSAKELYPHVTNLYDMFYNNTVDGKRLKKDERVDTMRIIEEMDKIVDAVIENAVGVDDTYVEMKKLLPELRNTKLVVPMDARADAAQSAGFENWAEFRKANFGRVGFANEGLPVDTYYMELSERYPELFPDGITHPGEQAAHIADVVNTIRESGINEYQLYDVEDERIRTSIKNDVMDIIGNAEKLQTFADRAAQKVEDTKLAEAMHYGADIAKLKRLNAEKVAGIKAENRKRLSDMRRKYQDRVESVRERYAEARANRSEKQKQTVLRNKVLRKYTEASSMLDRPTTENHFTEAMREPIMEFLAAVDITTGKSVAKQGIYDRILRVIEAANKVAAEGGKNGLDIAETDLNVQEKQLIVDSGLLERMSAWIEANQGKKLTELSSAQLFDQIVSNEPPVGYVHLDLLQQPYFAADTVRISYEQHTEKNLRLDSRASVILAVIRLADSAGTSYSNTILSQA